MSVLVYCFKLDVNEFNLKSEYKKYNPLVSRYLNDLRTIYSRLTNDKILN
ncbi:Fibronectin-binding protein [Staphylococcus argenteus]|nr:Fibronectin-binding protein [Staphylococcus argenteus]